MTSAWVGILVLSCLVVVALAGDKSPSSSKTPSLTPQSLSPTPSSTPSNTPSNSRPAALPSGWPTSRTVTGVIRDFHGLGENDCSTSNRICAQIPAGCQHNDFERAISNDRGIVLTTLGPDRLPQWNSAKFPSNTITSLDLANMWFHTQAPITVNGKTCYINQPANLSLTATWDSSRGLYTYQNSAFWPIDGVMGFNYPSLTSNHNFHFTFELHSQFIYAGLEVFTFTGDDDVWVFINNQLVLDLGGVHGAQTQCFSLIQPGRSGYPNGPCVDSACDGGSCIGNIVSSLNLVIGNTYNFDFFFAERHTTASNINFATNFPLDTCLTPDACGICNGPNSVNVCTGANPPNCGAHGSCICATGGCVCDAGWTGPNCDSFCGDGIVQSQEQCDTGATNTGCCNTTTCKFLSAGTTCPRESNPCIAQVCDGAGTCGVVQNTGSDGQPIVCASSAVTVNGVVDACKRYICNNGQCVVGPKPVGTDCGTSSCTQRQCNATGTCVVTGTVTCVSAGTCFGVGTCQANSNNNVYPGTCSNPPLSFGTSCGTSSNVCQVRVCDGTGNCITNNVADGTSCGSSGSCFANVCLSGQCTRTNTNTGSTCGSTPAQCTVNQCSDGSCVSLPAAGTCTGTGADSQCQSYSCSGGSCVVVNKAQGTSCTLASPNQCSVGQCSSGACVAVPANQGANCTSGSNGAVTDPGFCQDNVCQGTQCLPVNVNSGVSCPNGPTISVASCNNNVCVSGVCSTVATNQGGTCTGTGLATPSCQKYSCSNGACIVVAKNEGGTCPLSSANDCSSGVCSSGTCAAVAANAGQTCTNGSTGVGPAATFCTAPKCQGTVCAASNIKEGQTFSIGGSGCPALTTQACQQYRCVGGSCTVEATNVGGSCKNSTDCQKFVCQADGTCATVNINEGNVCKNNGTCTPWTCQSGQCTAAPITCTPPTSCYTIGACANGVCPTPVLTGACSCGDGIVQSPTSTPPGTEQCDTGSVANPCCSSCAFAASTTSCGTDTECKTFQCSGSSTECLQSNKPVGTPCSELVADECNDVQCDGSGNCVYSAKTGTSCGQPTDCQTAVCGTGNATQRATCQYTPLTDGVSCTSLTGTKECHTKTCSSGVCSFTYVGDSGAACSSLTDTECALAKCSATTKACALTSRRTSAASPSINCSSVSAGDCTIAQCNTNGACALVPLTGQSCSVSGYTPDGCADPVCSSAGLCALVPRTNGIDCSAASGLSAECQKATCSSGKCYLVFDPAASCTSLAPTDCSDPVCDAQTKACRHQSKRTSPSDPVIPCTGPTATACEAPQCGTDGSCGLVAQPGDPCTLDGFISDGCSNPVCDVDGVCSLEAVVDGTSCTLSGINPECQTSECVAGACTAVSKRQSASDPVISCTSVSDTPCEVAQCGLDGVCALVALADGHQSTCDALQDPTDVCSEMLCQAGSCVRTSLSAGTPCTDSNLCDVDTCDGNGECVRTPTDIANSCAVPLGPCFSAGWCESATGACNYTQFGAGTLCIPKTPDSGGCRYFTCSADAVCTKACVIHTVCGNGVVEPGEDCDWASRSFTSRCCSHNCTWFEEFTSCNATRNMTALLEDIPKGKQQYADECLSDYCDADHSCVTSWNQSVAKVCALGGSSKNTQYVAGVAAGLTVAACLAFGLAALALALFIWQMKKADQAWKKEFLDEHKGIIEQNAAFAGPATNPSNPAYGLH